MFVVFFDSWGSCPGYDKVAVLAGILTDPQKLQIDFLAEED